MTFGGHSEQHHLRPNGARLQMMLRGTQLYMPAKSHVIIIILLSAIHKAKSLPQ